MSEEQKRKIRYIKNIRNIKTPRRRRRHWDRRWNPIAIPMSRHHTKKQAQKANHKYKQPTYVKPITYDSPFNYVVFKRNKRKKRMVK